MAPVDVADSRDANIVVLHEFLQARRPHSADTDHSQHDLIVRAMAGQRAAIQCRKCSPSHGASEESSAGYSCCLLHHNLQCSRFRMPHSPLRRKDTKTRRIARFWLRLGYYAENPSQPGNGFLNILSPE